ncbi:MAG: MBOAT family O-acyltransferase [Bryobacterales bacterium]|nr:MBOAT family O-acyltransferase [Bryobacterales bacterium]
MRRIQVVQKNLFANSMGSWVDDGFLSRVAGLNTTLDNWFLAVAFGLQIYFDFSAYSNMAIGTARLLGVQLPENFRYPYHAGNPAEFWSRWHMTLSRWIRDYVFFPINARHGGAPAPLYLSLIGAMALVGLWHGAGWCFVVWGGLHGLWMVLFRIFERVRDRMFPQLAGSWWLGGILRAFTLAAVTATWIPFRAGSLEQSWAMLSSMLFRFQPGLSYSVNFYLVTLLFAGFCVIEPYLARLMEWFDTWCAERTVALAANQYAFRPLIYAWGLLMFMIFDDQDTQFIYFQF